MFIVKSIIINQGESKELIRDCIEGFDVKGVELYFYDTCDYPLCNSQDLSTYLQCYQCTENCETLAETNLVYCPNVNAQFCYTMRTEGGTLIHGCDKDEHAEECHERENCSKCEKGGCNDANPEPVQCTRCETTEDCKSHGSETEVCDFYEDCFLNQEAGELTKGCSSRLNSCSAENCKLCSGPRCNEHHCVQCSSKKHEDCVFGRGNVGYELCPAGEKCIAFLDGKLVLTFNGK